MADQKQIITQIKRNDSGIYYIKNLNSKKLYIGQSVQLGERAKTHIAQLEAGIHTNRELQEDYKKGDRFRIGIVQKAPRKLLEGLEIYYILKWNTNVVGYNVKIGITDNFDDALRMMITPKQAEEIEEEKLKNELEILYKDLYKTSSLSTINYLMKKNKWTIDDVFLFYKKASRDWLSKL